MNELQKWVGKQVRVAESMSECGINGILTTYDNVTFFIVHIYPPHRALAFTMDDVFCYGDWESNSKRFVLRLKD